jgi:hypothetical protein
MIGPGLSRSEITDRLTITLNIESEMMPDEFVTMLEKD